MASPAEPGDPFPVLAFSRSEEGYVLTDEDDRFFVLDDEGLTLRPLEELAAGRWCGHKPGGRCPRCAAARRFRKAPLAPDQHVEVYVRPGLRVMVARSLSGRELWRALSLRQGPGWGCWTTVIGPLKATSSVGVVEMVCHSCESSSCLHASLAARTTNDPSFDHLVADVQSGRGVSTGPGYASFQVPGVPGLVVLYSRSTRGPGGLLAPLFITGDDCLAGGVRQSLPTHRFESTDHMACADCLYGGYRCPHATLARALDALVP